MTEPFEFPKMFELREIKEYEKDQSGSQPPGCPPGPQGCTYQKQVTVGGQLYCQYTCAGGLPTLQLCPDEPS